MLGFQEALIRQVRDLEELLGTEFAWVRAFFRVPRRALAPTHTPRKLPLLFFFYQLLGDVID